MTWRGAIGRASTTLRARADVYTHGHHRSVVEQHAKRTVESCAAFLTASGALAGGTARLLDVGCGPGSITVGFAPLCGQVVGIDASEAVLETARETALQKVPDANNLSFQKASVYELPFEDDSFDVAYAHQVLQHLADPVAAAREMKRVVRPGGCIAVRDADYSSMLTYPDLPTIQEWRRIYRATCVRNGAQPDAGRYLLPWLMEAGFTRDQVQLSMAVTPYLTAEQVADWGQAWTKRALESDFAKQAVEYGIATWPELEAISQGWDSWSRTADAVFYYVNGEAIAYVE